MELRTKEYKFNDQRWRAKGRVCHSTNKHTIFQRYLRQEGRSENDSNPSKGA